MVHKFYRIFLCKTDHLPGLWVFLLRRGFGGLCWWPPQAGARGSLCDAQQSSVPLLLGTCFKIQNLLWPAWQLCLESGLISLTWPPDTPFCLEPEPALHKGCVGETGLLSAPAAASRAALLTLFSHKGQRLAGLTPSLSALLWVPLLSLLGLQSHFALLLLDGAVGK